jgi:hypothetical protein
MGEIIFLNFSHGKNFLLFFSIMSFHSYRFKPFVSFESILIVGLIYYVTRGQFPHETLPNDLASANAVFL